MLRLTTLLCALLLAATLVVTHATPLAPSYTSASPKSVTVAPAAHSRPSLAPESCSNVTLPTVGVTVICSPYPATIVLASDGCEGGSAYVTAEVREVAHYTGRPTSITCPFGTFSHR